MTEKFPYTSVHQYLDEVFKNQENVSNRDVKVAKRTYRKMYNTALKRRIRADTTEITLRFTKQEITKLKLVFSKAKSISKELKKLIQHFLNTGIFEISDKIDTSKIEQELFTISEYLEQVLEESLEIQKEKITEFISAIHHFEKTVT